MENNMIDGWLIYSDKGIKKNSNFINSLMDKSHIYNIEVELKCSNKFMIKTGIVNELYYDFIKIDKFPKWVFLRTLNVEISRFLESKGVTVINNSESMLIAKDKMRTHQILTENNINTPRTIQLFNKDIKYSNISTVLDSSIFIAKDNKGSQGSGVFLIENEKDFVNIENRIKKGKSFIFQEYIENTKGKDLRVYVLGNEVLGCVMRKSSNEEEFRANISVGGTSTKYELDEDIKQICLKVAKVFNSDFLGIDLLFTKTGYTVCEINSIAAFTSLRALPDVTFSNKFYEYIINRFKK